MHRFGDQIELRMDRRHILLFFLGAVLWTITTFFIGMFAAGQGHTRLAEKGLNTIGWLDKHAQERNAALFSGKKQPVRFSFAHSGTKQKVSTRHTQNAATHTQKQHTIAASPVIRRAALTKHVVAPRERPRARPSVLIKRAKPQKGRAYFAVELRFLNSKKAERAVRIIQKKGFRPRLALTRHPKRGRYYQVLVGQFRLQHSAQLLWKRIYMRGVKSGIVRQTRKK